jgi:hypothetical protein
MLFQMVEGRDLDSLLLELIGCIPWGALSASSDGDRQWFALSTTSPQIADSSSTVLQQPMSPTPSSRPPQAQEGAQTNMDMSLDSVQTPILQTTRTSGALPPDGEEVTDTRPTPSSRPPQAQEGAQTNMDMSPDSVQIPNQTISSTAHTSLPMDTREDDLTANNSPVLDKDTGRGEQGGDKPEEGVEDEQEQGINKDTLPTGSPPYSAVQPSRISRLKKTHPKIALTKKRLSRPAKNDDKNYMPSSEMLGETDLGRLLAAGKSYNMPIDVEAIDMLMRNFPITEEHQVGSLVDSLKSVIIVF